MSEPNSPHSGKAGAGDRVRRAEKPWGHEVIYAVTEQYCGKILFVRAGEALSLQFHRLKDETIYLYSGAAEVETREPGGARVVRHVTPGTAVRVRPHTIHRLSALEDSVFLEVSTPHLDDVVRVEDRYGRTD